MVQKKGISLTREMRDEAIKNLYCKTFPKRLGIADLGCSSGPNTLFVISEVIKLVEKLCQEHNQESPEYQVFMNDLQGNDFNNIFRLLDRFTEKLNDEVEGGIGQIFFYGAPGSFYGRIFPTKTMHFIHSSYSLQWLSQVPSYQ
jgi:salicylate 1-O-methyltransferase